MDKKLYRVTISILLCWAISAWTIVTSASAKFDQTFMPTDVRIDPASAKSGLYAAPDLSKKHANRSRQRPAATNAMQCRLVQSGIGGVPGYVCDSATKGKNKALPKVTSRPKKSPIQQTSPIEAGKVYRSSTPHKTAPLEQITMPPIAIDSQITETTPPVSPKSTSNSWYPYLNLMAGLSLARIGEKQQDNSDVYNSSNYLSGVMMYGIGSGYEFNIGHNALLSLGLGVYQNIAHDSKGQVSIQGTSYNYNYNLRNTRFMFELQLAKKLTWDGKMQLLPLFMAGIGPSLNRVSSYEEQNGNASAKFTSNSNTTFSYQLGAGLACTINDRNRLFVAYRYVGLGKAKFASAVGTTYQLRTGTVKTHEVCLGYTHLFNI